MSDGEKQKIVRDMDTSEIRNRYQEILHKRYCELTKSDIIFLVDMAGEGLNARIDKDFSYE